jgi:hypothetical protein
MTPTRTVPVLLLAAGLAVGCGGGSTAPKNTKDPDGKSGPVGPSKDDPVGGAVAAANEFLASVAAGKADPGKLTPAFKKVVADPVTEADKAQGYSDWAAEQWLKPFAGKVPTSGTGAAIGPDRVVVTAGQAGRAVLRMARAGGGWQVDWFHLAPPGAEAVSLTGGGDQLARAFTTVAFLDTALTNQRRLAEAVLTLGAKSRLAPPLGDPIGYNRGVLGVRLSKFREAATGYRVGNPSAEQMTGVLTGPEHPNGRPFTLKLVQGRNPGEWLVDDFQPN